MNILNIIKNTIKEFNTKFYIIIALTICIISSICTYFYLPVLLKEGIEHKKEYDKEHHLGWYSYHIQKIKYKGVLI